MGTLLSLVLNYVSLEWLIVNGLFGMFILWILFVNVMVLRGPIKERFDSGIMGVIVRVIEVPLTIVAIIWDIVWNISFGSLFFWQLPPKPSDYVVDVSFRFRRTFTLTERLRVILTYAEPGSWRYKLSRFICKNFITPWDKIHCRLLPI